jgi:protein-L-isoaspartate(D-aspartate) O-methyltransferase
MTNMMNTAEARRFFAEEIRVVHNVQSQCVIDAFATVPREQFLPPGPWQI